MRKPEVYKSRNQLANEYWELVKKYSRLRKWIGVQLIIIMILLAMLASCSSVNKFNAEQERIGRRYWQNVLEHQYVKNYSIGNPKAVRK